MDPSVIHRACRLGDTQLIQSIVEEYPEAVQSVDCTLGWTPLYRCVVYGHSEASKLLLEKASDPNTRSPTGETPLHQAADNSNVRLIEYLLEHNADPNLQQKDGNSPLHQAAYRGSVQVISLLLTYDADPNLGNFALGRTPLHNAVENGHVAAASLLVRSCAVSTLKDKTGVTPVDLARTSEMSFVLKQQPLSCIENNAKHAFSFGNSKKPILRDWLASHKLEELAEVPGLNDLEQLRSQMTSSRPITQDTLKSLGVKKPAHRRILLAALTEENSLKGTTTQHKQARTTLLQCCATTLNANLDFTTAPSLASWLGALKLPEYLDCFAESGISELESLLALAHTPWAIDAEFLREIGIDKPGYRHRILAKL